MTTLDQLRSVHRSIAALHREISPMAHVPEAVKVAAIGLELRLRGHLDRYLTARSRAAENDREADVLLARLFVRFWPAASEEEAA